jgi:hypothetical protein
MQHESSTEPILTKGYATTAEHAHGPGYYWVCADCAADFAEEFGWILVEEFGWILVEE